jgi:hypothetical protein
MIYDIFKRKEGRLQKIIILIIVFLVLLIPLGIYAADNLTEEIQPLEEQPIENTSNTAEDLCESITCEDFSLECPDGFVASCSTSCNSETGECDFCEPGCTGHEIEEIENTTETNETIEINQTNQTQEIPEEIPSETILAPELNIQISYPEKINRGDVILLSTNLTNIGNAEAKGVSIDWELASGFNIVQGNAEENLGDLRIGETISSEISIEALYSTSLGNNEIKIKIGYQND